MTAKILIADDERAITEGLSAILRDEGYDTEIASDGERALQRLIAEPFGVVLADLKMPKVDGVALLREIRQRGMATECIVISGQGTIRSAVDAVTDGGAFYFIEKPLNAEKLSELKALIKKALESFELKRANRALTTELATLTHYGELTGQSEAMRSVYGILDAVAPSSASVLILGESGTGKELVARAIHNKSDRVKGPFLALNCAALPKDILENELFGHEKGAFTGSTNEKPGAFEMADGGTLFLDEVGEMATDIQVKLLRALESRSVRRLGGKKEIPVDIRVVAATNKNLQRALDDGELREDLYYRLAVVEIELPPLRDRVGDIKLLAAEFLSRFSRENNKKIHSFEDDAIEWILRHNWPGNVRELRNTIESAVIMSKGATIGTADIIPRRLRAQADSSQATVTLTVGATLADARRQMLLRTFSATGGDVERTARTLGVSESEVRNELGSLLGPANTAGGGADAARANGAVKPAARAAAKEKGTEKAKGKAKGRR
jgi:DNA-binding NtrC family response regulator